MVVLRAVLLCLVALLVPLSLSSAAVEKKSRHTNNWAVLVSWKDIKILWKSGLLLSHDMFCNYNDVQYNYNGSLLSFKVCASRYWFNYRHIANTLSMYRSVKRLGIPDRCVYNRCYLHYQD